MAAFLARLLQRVYPKHGIEARQLEQIEYTTGTVNNFGSSTTVTIYAYVTTVTSASSLGTSSTTTTTYVTTVPTATSYSTPTPPLTTTFTPPSSCLSGFYNLEGVGWVPGPPFAKDCLPPGYATTIYYSPGICPSGYISLTETVNNLETGSNSGIQESVVTCCPSGYTLGDFNAAYPCTSPFNPSISSSNHLFSPTTTSTFDFTIPDISIGTTTVDGVAVATTNSVDLIITGTGGWLNAQSIQVRWKNGDFSSGSTTHTSSATSAPTSSTPTPGPPVLSQGAAIAIGVIVPLVVVGILLAAFLWLRAKKRTSRYNLGFLRPPPGTEDIAIPGPPPRDGPELEAKTIRPELDSFQNYPKSGSNGATELPHWQKTPAAMEVDFNISRSAVRSFSDPIPNSGISLPSSTSAYNIYRKPVADPSPSSAVPPDPPITHPGPPIPTILRPGIPPSTAPTSSVQPLPQPYNSHSPLTSSEPSMASLPLDGTSQDTSNNLLALQRTYEKVREERERLNKLQELTELEERLRSQIEAQIHGGGDAGS